jgi:sugar phosphate isomerase/epimerase
MLKDAGFDAYDFSMFTQEWMGTNAFLAQDDYLEKAKKLRVFADSIGLPCNQAHAPFPTLITDDVSHEGISCDEFNARMHAQIERAIEVAGVLGAKVIVVHPWNYYSAEENAKVYKSFEPVARKAGVKIGVENMWNWWNWGKPDGHVMPAACSHQDDFFAHMELLPKDVFVACVDIGHAEMMHAFGTTAVQMIEKLGDYMQCMHLHDVDFVNDNHSYPFNCSIDYAPIIEALRKIGYKGDITMEASTPIKNVPVQLMPAATRYLAEIGKYFKEEIEKE